MNMQRFTIALGAMLIFLSSGARADMVNMDGTIALSVKGEDWAVQLPESDWALAEERLKPDGTGVFYYLVSNSRSLNFSIFLDQTDACDSGESCRDHFWVNPHPQYKDARDVQHSSRNGFAISTMHFDRVMGMPATQTNITAHAYRNGYWIDVTLYKIGGTAPPIEPLLEFLDTLTVK
jgi:hypothetical protein